MFTRLDDNWGSLLSKGSLPLYLADTDVLFEKPNHYPLVLIRHANLLFLKITEGHNIYWQSDPAVRRAPTGQLKYKMEKRTVAAVRYT